MTTFLSLLINGLSIGAIYALVALGFVIIFKVSEVLNFAHGSMVLLGAYVTARAEQSLGFPAAVVIGVAATAVLGVLIERGLFARVHHAQATQLTILTLGLDILIATDLTRRIGSNVLSPGQPWGADTVSLGGVGITTNRLIAFCVAAVLIGVFFLAFRFSDWGVTLRASAEDPETASLMGIRQARVKAGAWLVAGALAAVAAIFLTGSPAAGVEPSVRTVAFAAFPAAVLGGLDSPSGALAGGLVIGVAESLVAGYQNSLSFLGDGFGSVVPYAVMLLVLLVRPSGLFGTKELARV